MVAIARRYSGESGAELLAEQGYPPEMIADMDGAGTRTIKMRGGMGLLGVLGKYGMYCLCNSLALLDVHIRGVKPEEAKAGRIWSNYTWHGDQAPGHPWVHGLQNSETDFNDLRFSKLIIMNGKNLVENKMADAHWFIECMERGAKIVVIAPEYGAPSTKADYWIPVRPATDAALWLGVTRLMIDRRWYDEAFVKNFTDFPFLIRVDNLQRLRAAEVFPQYKSARMLDVLATSNTLWGCGGVRLASLTFTSPHPKGVRRSSGEPARFRAGACGAIYRKIFTLPETAEARPREVQTCLP